MKSLTIPQPLKLIIDENSRVPKYLQIADSIVRDIGKGNLELGTRIPSIDTLSESCNLSRGTVAKAYKLLKRKKVIVPVQGKGFFTAKTDLISKINVLFLINKPSSYKMLIYDSFVDSIGVDGHVVVSVFHCDESLFIEAIEKNLGAFDYYVILPHFRNERLRHTSFTEKVIKTINMIPEDKLIFLDNTIPEIKGDYGAIFQDFKQDIYVALKEGLENLKKYSRLILVYPNNSAYPYPRAIFHGFRQFCVDNSFDFEVIEEIYDDMELQGKDTYITLEEVDLVKLVLQIRKKGLVMGKDIGVISYNDTPLKALIGITVISTDFEAMGKKTAQMILKKQKKKIKNPFRYIERNSV